MFGVITLITALATAATAAWFAIVGIVALFSGEPVFGLGHIPIIIMGMVVEACKLVGVSWVYRHWNEKTKLKFVAIPLIIVAMGLTSMGIFGFLSKAHLEQNAPVSNNTLKIERLDQRITREQSRINDAETVIEQLDKQVQTLIEYDKISGPNGSRAVRAGQEEQRNELRDTIDESQDKIDEYQDEKLVLNQEIRALELEVGPVKYIAEIIYEDPKSKIEDAVRVVIFAFIFVFDPMAIILLMAANHTLMQRQPQRKNPAPPTSAAPHPPTPTPPSPPKTIVPKSEASFVPAEQKSQNQPPPKAPVTTRHGKFVKNDRDGLKHQKIGQNNVK